MSTNYNDLPDISSLMDDSNDTTAANPVTNPTVTMDMSTDTAAANPATSTVSATSYSTALSTANAASSSAINASSAASASSNSEGSGVPIPSFVNYMQNFSVEIQNWIQHMPVTPMTLYRAQAQQSLNIASTATTASSASLTGSSTTLTTLNTLNSLTLSPAANAPTASSASTPAASTASTTGKSASTANSAASSSISSMNSIVIRDYAALRGPFYSAIESENTAEFNKALDNFLKSYSLDQHQKLREDVLSSILAKIASKPEKNHIENAKIHNEFLVQAAQSLLKFDANPNYKMLPSFFLPTLCSDKASNEITGHLIEIAIKSGRRDILEILLQHNVDVNILLPDGMRPLYLAIYYSDHYTCQLLLKYKAKQKLPSGIFTADFGTPVSRDYDITFSTALEYATDLAVRSECAKSNPHPYNLIITILLQHQICGKNKELIESINTTPIDPNRMLIDDDAGCGHTVLSYAITEKLNAFDIILNFSDENSKQHAIYWAVVMEDIDNLKKLIKKTENRPWTFKCPSPIEASLNEDNNDFATKEILNILIDAKRFIHHKNKNNKSSLMCILESDHKLGGIVKKLLDLGVDYQIPDNQGNTPLHYASEQYEKEVFKALLAKKPELNILNKAKMTPLATALNREEPEAALLLLKNNAIIEYPGIKENMMFYFIYSLNTGALELDGEEIYTYFKTLNTVFTLLVKGGCYIDNKPNKEDLAERLGIVTRGLISRAKSPISSEYSSFIIDSIYQLSANYHYIYHISFSLDGPLSDYLKVILAGPNLDIAKGELENNMVRIPSSAFINSRRSRDGMTPLHLALLHGHFLFTLVAIKKGYDAHISNHDGKTPYQLMSSLEQDLYNILHVDFPNMEKTRDEMEAIYETYEASQSKKDNQNKYDEQEKQNNQEQQKESDIKLSKERDEKNLQEKMHVMKATAKRVYSVIEKLSELEEQYCSSVIPRGHEKVEITIETDKAEKSEKSDKLERGGQDIRGINASKTDKSEKLEKSEKDKKNEKDIYEIQQHYIHLIKKEIQNIQDELYNRLQVLLYVSEETRPWFDARFAYQIISKISKNFGGYFHLQHKLMFMLAHTPDLMKSSNPLSLEESDSSLEASASTEYSRAYDSIQAREVLKACFNSLSIIDTTALDNAHGLLKYDSSQKMNIANDNNQDEEDNENDVNLKVEKKKEKEKKDKKERLLLEKSQYQSEHKKYLLQKYAMSYMLSSEEAMSVVDTNHGTFAEVLMAIFDRHKKGLDTENILKMKNRDLENENQALVAELKKYKEKESPASSSASSSMSRPLSNYPSDTKGLGKGPNAIAMPSTSAAASAPSIHFQFTSQLNDSNEKVQQESAASPSRSASTSASINVSTSASTSATAQQSIYPNPIACALQTNIENNKERKPKRKNTDENSTFLNSQDNSDNNNSGNNNSDHNTAANPATGVNSLSEPPAKKQKQDTSLTRSPKG